MEGRNSLVPLFSTIYYQNVFLSGILGLLILLSEKAASKMIQELNLPPGPVDC